MKKTLSIWNILLLLALCVASGCAPMLLAGGAATGATIVAFVKGELVSSEGATLNQAWMATQEALSYEELTITEKSRDELTGWIIAYGSGNQKIEINLKKETLHVTQIKIRVGIFGDESLSRHILEEIQHRYPAE